MYMSQLDRLLLAPWRGGRNQAVDACLVRARVEADRATEQVLGGKEMQVLYLHLEEEGKDRFDGRNGLLFAVHSPNG